MKHTDLLSILKSGDIKSITQAFKEQECSLSVKEQEVLIQTMKPELILCYGKPMDEVVIDHILMEIILNPETSYAMHEIFEAIVEFSDLTERQIAIVANHKDLAIRYINSLRKKIAQLR